MHEDGVCLENLLDVIKGLATIAKEENGPCQSLPHQGYMPRKTSVLIGRDLVGAVDRQIQRRFAKALLGPVGVQPREAAA